MRKLLLFSFFCLMALGAWADDSTTDYFSVSELKLTPGGDAGYVDVTLHGSLTYTAFQMDMELPLGLSVATSDNGALLVAGLKKLWPSTEDPVTGDITYSHLFQSGYGDIGKRTLRVICYSSKSEPFTAQEGALFRVFLKASVYAKAGTADIKLTNAVLTLTDGSDKKPDDQTVNSVSVDTPASMDLTVSSTDKWATALVPFAAAVPEGLRAFTCEGTEDKVNANGVTVTYLKLKEATDFTAYTSYLLYAESGFTGSISGNLDESAYPSTTTVNPEGTLRSSLEPIELGEGYVMKNEGGEDGTMFYLLYNETAQIAEGGSWVIIPATSRVITSIALATPETTTGINAIAAQQAKVGSIYAIDGKAISTPYAGSIYIIGGKKYIQVK